MRRSNITLKERPKKTKNNLCPTFYSHRWKRNLRQDAFIHLHDFWYLKTGVILCRNLKVETFLTYFQFSYTWRHQTEQEVILQVQLSPKNLNNKKMDGSIQ